MKPLISSLLIFLFLFLSWCLSALAQGSCGLTVFDKGGAQVGRISGDGHIYNGMGLHLGHIKKGVVYEIGEKVGTVSKGGTIRDEDGRLMASVGAGGYISTGGRIARDGTIFNSSGARVGRFKGYSSQCRHVAAAYLMFFNSIHRR